MHEIMQMSYSPTWQPQRQKDYHDPQSRKHHRLPAMAVPVSIGDILLLSKIAYNIGVAFTSGRKSAPREFVEVENQLFALSTALELLTQYVEKTDSTPTSNALVSRDSENPVTNEKILIPPNALQSMIINCKRTLEGLENVVKKYCKAMDPIPAPAPQNLPRKSGASFPKRKWQKVLKDNLSRVAWTTEGDNLATLRDQLVTHIASITLVMNTMQSSKTDSIDEQLQKIYKRLEAKNPIPEISNLTVQNITLTNEMYRLPTLARIEDIEDNQIAHRMTDITTRIASPRPNPGELMRSQTLSAPETEKPSYTNEPMFQVCFASNDGDLQVVCPKACIYHEWVPNTTATITEQGNVKRQSVFFCRCKGSSVNLGSEVSAGNELSLYSGSHTQELDDIYLFPMSFATRITGAERKWCVFPAACQSSGTYTMLVIKGVRPTDLDEFERKFVDRLNLSAALDMMQRRKPTTFVYPITNDSNNYRVAFLHFMGDDSKLKGCLKSVEFYDTSGGKRAEKIDYMQILAYKTVPLSALEQGMEVQRDQFQYSETAEIAIHFQRAYKVEDQRSIFISLNADTVVENIPESPRRLLIKNINGTTSERGCITRDLVIRMTSTTALRNIHEMIEEIKTELYIQTLRGPSSTEYTIFQMYAGDIRITDKLITDAEVRIICDSSVDPEKYRLLIRSLNGSSYFCKEIPGPADFPSPLSRLLIGHAAFIEMVDPVRVTVFPEGLADEGGLHFVAAAFEYVFTTELEALAEQFSNQDIVTSRHLLEAS